MMDLKESTVTFVVRPVEHKDILPFIRLRSLIERESMFMPTDEGGRKENVIYAVVKMLWHRKRIVNLVATDGEEVAGFATIIFGRFRKFRGNAYIANISVRSDKRGKGIGKLLLRKAEEFARERQARRLELEVFAKNVVALKLYKKHGYEVEGVKRRSVEGPDGFDDLVFMAKFL